MSPEWFTLLGVLLGSIISQAGTIIARLNARDNERKSIFEARFKEAEEKLDTIKKEITNFHREIRYGNIHTQEDKAKISSRFDKIFPELRASIIELKNLRLTDDSDMIKYVLDLFDEFNKYKQELEKETSAVSGDNKVSVDANPLFEICFLIKDRIDRFRLNNYQCPRSKFHFQKLPPNT